MKYGPPEANRFKHRCTRSDVLSVAVVGAGISGITCARALVDQGFRVRVFDKARGPGGRMSTRRDGSRSFDHGAQYFTVRDGGFARSVDSWRREGIVEKWSVPTAVIEGGRATVMKDDTVRWVGVPGMNAVCARMAADLDVSFETRVGNVERIENRWLLEAENGTKLGRFEALVVSAPAPQTAELLESAAPELAARANEVKTTSCWAVMVSFSRPLDLDFDRAFVHDSPLSWVAHNTSKPKRPDDEAWILHGTPDWSSEHLDIDAESAAERLLVAFNDAIGGLGGDPSKMVAHRWRFALPTAVLADACLFDPKLRLAICGDWCGGPRVEGAYLSGCTAAARLGAMSRSSSALDTR